MGAGMEEVIKKNFWFLVKEYGFSYQHKIFSSSKLEIRIELEREPPETYLPGLYFRLVEEANCPILPFDWILFYFEGVKPNFDFHGKSLDENAKYISDLLKKYSQKLFFEVDNWWIPAHKFRLKYWENLTHKSPVRTFQQVYDYIKAKEGH